VTDVKQGKITLFKDKNEPQDLKVEEPLVTPSADDTTSDTKPEATPKLRW
jgi:hypothetical protein